MPIASIACMPIASITHRCNVFTHAQRIAVLPLSPMWWAAQWRPRWQWRSADWAAAVAAAAEPIVVVVVVVMVVVVVVMVLLRCFTGYR